MVFKTVSSIELGAAQLGIGCKVTIAKGEEIAADKSDASDRQCICSIQLSGKDTRAKQQTWDILSAFSYRRSANGFRDLPLTMECLNGIVQTGTGLAANLTRPTSIYPGLNLALRTDNDWSFPTPIDSLIANAAPNSMRNNQIDAVNLFMSQRFVESAGAILLITAPISTKTETVHLNMLAGQIGQCLYATASRDKIGICCVGGFDSDEASTTFALPNSQHPIYAMVLGHSSNATEKVDRETHSTRRFANTPA